MDGTARQTIAYQPALDGVRALAVAVVLLFHAEVPGFSGGYLGVSVFFTLSGYLITSLLVHEHDRKSTIDLGAFYARRIRRLMPASALSLGAIVVLASVTDWFAGVADLRRQVVGCVLQVANWVFLAGEGSYQQIFQQAGGARSPLEHFWSLAIEEQFYWVWPPTMFLLLSRLRTQRARTLGVGTLTALFAVAAPVIAVVWGSDAAYWATPARISEILAGAVLAVALQGRQVPHRTAWLAPVALVALAVCVVTFPASSGPAYQGWLPLVAAGSALLVLGLQAPGPVRSALSTAPFVWLGRISYGVYLYHWPIYVIVDEQRTGWSGAPLVLAQLALTLALAQVSYWFVESPIRQLRGAVRRPTFALGALATAMVVVAGLVVVPHAGGEYWITDDATVQAAAIDVDDAPLTPLTATTSPTSGVTTSVPPTTAPSGSTPSSEPLPTDAATAPPSSTEAPLPPLARPVRIIVAGDSTARATGTGLLYWAARHPELAQVELVGAPGCGFLLGGQRREGGWKNPPDACDDWLLHELPDRVAEVQPDVVMLMVTVWDVVDHKWDDGVEHTPLDPAFKEHLVADYQRVVDDLLAAGAGSIAWVEGPVPNVWWGDKGTGQEDPARHDVVRAVMEGVAAADPDHVGVVPLARWLDDEGLTDDHDVRPDGVHFEPTQSLRVAERYLGERLIRIALR